MARAELLLIAVVMLSGCESSHRVSRTRADPYPIAPDTYRVTVDDSESLPFNERDDFPRWVDYEVRSKNLCKNGADITDKRIELLPAIIGEGRRIHYTVRCK